MRAPLRVLLLVVIMSFSVSFASASSHVTLFEDDFGTAPGISTSEWIFFGAGGFTGNDGIETTSDDGLTVVSPGINPVTGEPMFTSTVAQEGSASNPFGMPGGFDHVKWLMYTARATLTGVPGYTAPAGQELVGSATISGELFGTEGHPFKAAVTDAENDPRLAAVAFNAVDLESWMVFDFFITNDTVYAIYERLPFGRPALGNYASFTFMIPLQERTPDDWHNLSIAYDRDAGVVRWLIDGEEVYRVDRIGYLLDRQYMVLNHGGVEELVKPAQLNFGMGTFTLLDAELPKSKALVQLSNAPSFYYDTKKGEPKEQKFVDPVSEDTSRLFGQGAELRVQQFTVELRPSVVNGN